MHDEAKKAVEMYQSGLTVKAIRERLGRSKTIVNEWLREAGVERRPVNIDRTLDSLAFDEKILDAIRDLARRGQETEPMEKLASRLGVSGTRIGQGVRRLEKAGKLTVIKERGGRIYEVDGLRTKVAVVNHVRKLPYELPRTPRLPEAAIAKIYAGRRYEDSPRACRPEPRWRTIVSDARRAA